MNKNINTCVCNIGFNKGALKKTIENNIFTIFGNISKNSTIVLRYHGELIDNICYELYNNNLYIRYFFDNDTDNIIEKPLAKCTKCVGESYCSVIELENHEKLTFLFTIENESHEKTEVPMSFNLTISNNPFDDFIEKYDHASQNLPVLETPKEIKLKNILNSIKLYFKNLYKKVRSTSY